MTRSVRLAMLCLPLAACEFDILHEPGGATGNPDPTSEIVSPWGADATIGGDALGATGGATGGATANKPLCEGIYAAPGGQLNITGALPAGVAGKCTIQANVNIQGSLLDAHLEPLANLQLITGTLTIANTVQLVSINGLRGLKTVNGTIQVNNNKALLSLNGLANLLTAQSIFINTNPQLTSAALPPIEVVSAST